ncbi:MAG: helix-turn-helix transcriptional regulator [Deltaproteobacteria bacterium]|nr:helix-turn-helix transcriptional regulator [Deltaproteobacteria bacterium]
MAFLPRITNALLLPGCARRPEKAWLPVSWKLDRPAVSQHLKVLKEAGLVTGHADGKRHIYQIDPGGLSALRTWLDRHWELALAGFKEFVEQAIEEDDN